MASIEREPAPGSGEAIVRVRGLEVVFGDKAVLDHLDLDIMRGEILGVIGASGSGKSVLARTILGLLPKRNGSIEIFGQDLDELRETERRALEQRCGVMFQQGALFSSLTITENIQLPMRELLHLSPSLLTEMAMLKIEMVGLPLDAAEKYPSELSGGMTKRAALARARSRPGDPVSGRADLRARPDRGRCLRSALADPQGEPEPDGDDDHP